MLIRIAAHPRNNPRLIDKMIVIKGIPYDWIFKKVERGDQLLKPWEPDVDANIPNHIRHLCTPITFVQWFPPINTDRRNYDGFWDKRTCFGLKLEYSYGPGRDMWDKIEDLIDRSLSRFEKMPDAVVVAKDQKSPFETFLIKKSDKGTEMIASEIPVVDLRRETEIVTLVTPSMTTAVEVPIVNTVTEVKGSKCECGKVFEKERAMRMHKMKAHPKVKVEA